MTPRIGHGAFVALSAAAPEIVARRMILRDRARTHEARVAAAQWLRVNGTRPDRGEAVNFLNPRRIDDA